MKKLLFILLLIGLTDCEIKAGPLGPSRRIVNGVVNVDDPSQEDPEWKAFFDKQQVLTTITFKRSFKNVPTFVAIPVGQPGARIQVLSVTNEGAKMNYIGSWSTPSNTRNIHFIAIETE